MSGIIALIRTDGQPIDDSLLTRMCESMQFRGPDGQARRVLGGVGFGHALLATTDDSRPDEQPLSLDGKTWIVADARVDGQEELRRSLDGGGCECPGDAGDAELLLYAYATWGVGFLERIIGDFAFVLWDQRQRRLLWARDHFGVKPLFWARIGEELVIGNTIDTIRLHPEISDELDDVAVADLLTVDFLHDAEATIFRDVRRVPPATVLSWEGGTPAAHEYWTLPTESPIHYSREVEYLDHFNRVFSSAVRDRMRARTIGISMSGGIDSTTVAATAMRIAAEMAESPSIKAFTIVYERLFDDQERYWTRLAAEHLRLPVHWTIADDYPLMDLSTGSDGGDREAGAGADTLFDAQSRAVAEHTRVLLTGYGGDPVCRGSSGYYAEELKALRIASLVRDVVRTLRMGKMPPLQLRTLWRRWRRRQAALRTYPTWLDRGFERRRDLPARWRRIQMQAPVGWSAAQELASPFWPSMFEIQDPGLTRYPIEVRHPFFDLRVVQFMLRVPTIPWQLGKVLPRRAMRGLLPEAVLARPKSVLGGDPVRATLGDRSREWWETQLAMSPEIERFIDTQLFLQSVERGRPGDDASELHRVIGVSHALRRIGGRSETDLKAASGVASRAEVAAKRSVKTVGDHE
ncbi:MAG: asparagine synthase-related protein [Acidobacteriota bacterium]|nr:asparagine synthase-related protein [Acidobacteriota bacterium]